MRVSRKRDPLNHEYTLHGKVLEVVESVKHLGVTITSDLRWTQHISNIGTKGNQTLGLLSRNLRINSLDLKSIAYKGLVRPNVEYTSTVWDPYTKQNKDRVEMVQRRAARYVLNCYERTASVTEMLKQLDWDTLELRRKKARLTTLYKMHCNLVEIDQQSNRNISSQPADPADIRTNCGTAPASKTNYHLHSFFPNTIKEWDSPPLNVVEAQSINSFLAQLNMLLFCYFILIISYYHY